MIMPMLGEIREAKRHPNSWQEVGIAGHFGPNDRVPLEAIVGAWKVNANGEIVPILEKVRPQVLDGLAKS